MGFTIFENIDIIHVLKIELVKKIRQTNITQGFAHPSTTIGYLTSSFGSSVGANQQF